MQSPEFNDARLLHLLGSEVSDEYLQRAALLNDDPLAPEDGEPTEDPSARASAFVSEIRRLLTGQQPAGDWYATALVIYAAIQRLPVSNAGRAARVLWGWALLRWGAQLDNEVPWTRAEVLGYLVQGAIEVNIETRIETLRFIGSLRSDREDELARSFVQLAVVLVAGSITAHGLASLQSTVEQESRQLREYVVDENAKWLLGLDWRGVSTDPRWEAVVAAVLGSQGQLDHALGTFRALWGGRFDAGL